MNKKYWNSAKYHTRISEFGHRKGVGDLGVMWYYDDDGKEIFHESIDMILLFFRLGLR